MYIYVYVFVYCLLHFLIVDQGPRQHFPAAGGAGNAPSLGRWRDFEGAGGSWEAASCTGQPEQIKHEKYMFRIASKE